jgi:hypothetical protein
LGGQIRSRRIGHCCVIDGVLEPAEDAGDLPQSVRFRPAAELTPEAVAAIAEQVRVRVRVLRWFARSGLIEAEDVREMLAWDNSGFLLDAAVRVGAHDRAGLGGHAHHRFRDRGRARRADSLGSRRAHRTAADCPRAPRRCASAALDSQRCRGSAWQNPKGRSDVDTGWNGRNQLGLSHLPVGVEEPETTTLVAKPHLKGAGLEVERPLLCHLSFGVTAGLDLDADLGGDRRGDRTRGSNLFPAFL